MRYGTRGARSRSRSKKYHHRNNSQQIAIPFMNQKVESSSPVFLVHSLFLLPWHNLAYIIYAQIVHIQVAPRTCTQSNAEESSTKWNSMVHGSHLRIYTTCGTLSAFDHAFNLLKLQLKLEKNSEMISLFFALVGRTSSGTAKPIFHLFNIFDSRNVISFASFFSSIFIPLLHFFDSDFFFLPCLCMILIQFIAYLKTHKN